MASIVPLLYTFDSNIGKFRVWHTDNGRVSPLSSLLFVPACFAKVLVQTRTAKLTLKLLRGLLLLNLSLHQTFDNFFFSLQSQLS